MNVKVKFFLIVSWLIVAASVAAAEFENEFTIPAPGYQGLRKSATGVSSTTAEGEQNLQRLSAMLQEIPTEEDLPELDYVGNNGEFSVFPLENCMGDCDSDDDCAGNLRCYSREANEDVPGCVGGVDNDNDSDYCYIAETPTPTNQPSDSPSLMPTPYPIIQVLVGNGTDPVLNQTLSPPSLAACQGVCRGDSDCSVGLVCYRRNLGEDVPYCIFEDDNIRQSSLFLDFCTLPPTPDPTPAPTTAQPSFIPSQYPTMTPTTKAPTPWPTPGELSSLFVTFKGNPAPDDLQRCEGDCDSDRDCAGNLICYQRDAGDEVPGCTFTPQEGASLSDGTDICVDRRSLGNQVRLRLYWRQGYRWQEESREHKWCMAHSQDGTCHYGLEARSCRSDEIYTDWCGGSSRQIFEIMYQPSGEFMIKAVTRNKCLQGSRPKLRDCDPNDPDQLWHPMNGGYDSESFEITRKGREDRCLSQHHHPKKGEVIELVDCARERKYTTNAWQFYW